MMLKKIVSVVLSVAICCGSVALSQFTDTKNDKSAKTGTEKEEAKFESLNSLGNYIQQMSEQKHEENDQFSGICSFFVGNATFDGSTGKLEVETTQSSVCMLQARFITDDESRNLADKYEVKLSAGEKVETEINVYTARLPQYYTIEVQLTGINGEVLCNPFCISTYTKEVQYVVNSDVNDFNPEYVVNFDESDQTNFIVLNEETVRAETTENYNLLLSADYEKGEFIFENADDTVNNLKEGDYFYIQPNQNDIIAISVDSVKQEDGKTIVRDSGENINDMFDLVKFETVAETNESNHCLIVIFLNMRILKR